MLEGEQRESRWIFLADESETATGKSVSKDVVIGTNAEGDKVDVSLQAKGEDLAEEDLCGRVSDRPFSQSKLDVFIVDMDDDASGTRPQRRESP